MSKNIKKIVAIALAIGTVSAALPAANINLLTTKAYAASNDDTELESLELQTESGSKIKLYSSSSYDSDDKVDSDEVSNGDMYYAKTSSKTVSIDIEGPSSKYVRVFKGTSDSAKGKKISSDISLDSGSTTTLIVKVYDEEPDDDVRYDDGGESSEYKIKVKCTADSSDSSSSDDSDSSDNADDYDDIYLEKLSVNGQSADLSDSKVKYTFNVDSDIDEATIKATPPDSDDDEYDVTIDGDSVDSDDKFKTTVDLKKGENTFKVEIEDSDDNSREYTVVINRGTTTSTTGSTTTNTASSTPNTATDTTAIVKNKWVQVAGQWQYKDAAGNTVKNTWVGNYFLKADGNMATGWVSYGGKWYYVGYDGAKKSGWQSVNGIWYYLDTQGVMATGWIRDMGSGKYYYLNNDGSMAYNTTVSGYKLGADGAWTTK